MSHPPRHALPQSAESFVRFEFTGWYLRHLVSPFPNYVSSNSTSTSDIHHSITVLRIINFNAAFIRITTTTQRCIPITSATIRSRQEEGAWRDVHFCVWVVCIEFWNLWDTPFLYHPNNNNNNVRMYTGRWTDQQLFSINKLVPLFTRHK